MTCSSIPLPAERHQANRLRGACAPQGQGRLRHRSKGSRGLAAYDPVALSIGAV